MKKNTVLLFLFTMLFSTSIFAQYTIQGVAKDKKTKEGLPFAHIGIEGSATVAVSDFDGIFSITIPKAEMGESLVISVMGYNNFKMSIKEIQSKNMKEFLLESATFDLAEAVVRSPEKILADAVSKIEENFWSEDFMIEGFYRKAAIEDNKFAYLTEAMVRVSSEGYHKTSKHTLGIEITQLRSSEDFRKIEVLEHNNPLMTGFYERDQIKCGGIHDILEQTKTKLATMETSVYNGENIYIINVGTFYIFIGFENDEIYRIDYGKNRELGTSYQYRKYKGKLYQFYHRRRWMPKYAGRDIGPVLVGRYYERDIKREAEAEITGTIQRRENEDASQYFERTFWATRKIHSEMSKNALRKTPIDNIGMVHEFTVTKVVIKSEEKYKVKTNINLREDIFKTRVYYDKKFWENLKFATESKYLQLMRADLEAAADGKTLEEQYSEVGRANNEGDRKFRKRMAKEE